eukprot:276580_1
MILLHYHRDTNANKPVIREYRVKDCDIQRLCADTFYAPILPFMAYLHPNDAEQRSHLWRSMLGSYNQYYFDYIIMKRSIAIHILIQMMHHISCYGKLNRIGRTQQNTPHAIHHTQILLPLCVFYVGPTR